MFIPKPTPKYDLGRIREMLSPYGHSLPDYPVSEFEDCVNIPGEQKLNIECSCHGILHQKLTPVELRKRVVLSGHDWRNPCFQCVPRTNILSYERIKYFFEINEPFMRCGVRMALCSTREEIENQIKQIKETNEQPFEKLRVSVKPISPTYGLVKEEISVYWKNLLKGKQVFPVSGGRHSSSHFLFFILLKVSGFNVSCETVVEGITSQKGKLLFHDICIYDFDEDIYYEIDGGYHFKKIKKSRGNRFESQTANDNRKDLAHKGKLRRIITYDKKNGRELQTRKVIKKLLRERENLLIEAGRPVTDFDLSTLSKWSDIRLLFNNWPEKISQISSGFYSYLRPATEVSIDHVYVTCPKGHISCFEIYDFAKIFNSKQKNDYKIHGCIGCQNQVKLDEFSFKMNEIMDQWPDSNWDFMSIGKWIGSTEHIKERLSKKIPFEIKFEFPEGDRTLEISRKKLENKTIHKQVRPNYFIKPKKRKHKSPPKPKTEKPKAAVCNNLVRTVEHAYINNRQELDQQNARIKQWRNTARSISLYTPPPGPIRAKWANSITVNMDGAWAALEKIFDSDPRYTLKSVKSDYFGGDTPIYFTHQCKKVSCMQARVISNRGDLTGACICRDCYKKESGQRLNP